MKRRRVGSLVVQGALAAALYVACAAAPFATTGCRCGEPGTAIVLDEALAVRRPAVAIAGEPCAESTIECMQRDGEDRCNVFWVVPKSGGLCEFRLHFDDGTSIERPIDFVLDEKYPCRGNIRTVDDSAVRISAEAPAKAVQGAQG